MADEMHGVPEALRLAALLDADEWPGSMSLVGYARACVAELLRLHAELEAHAVQAAQQAPAAPSTPASPTIEGESNV